MPEPIDPTQPIDLRILTTGENWMKIGSSIALGLNGYFSPLPDGSTISITTAHTGRMIMQGPYLVDEGMYHLQITTPPWIISHFNKGFGIAKRNMDFRAIWVLPHFDQLAFAVRSDLGIRSLRDLRERRYPLRVTVPPRGLEHPSGWAIDEVLAQYDMSLHDIERWGGLVAERKVQGRNRVDAFRENLLDAVFDEAIMTRDWYQITEENDMTFLPIEDEVLQTLHRDKGFKLATLPKDRLRGINEDMPTVDQGDYVLYCRADFPEEFAYLTAKATYERAADIRAQFEPMGRFAPMTGKVTLEEMCDSPDVPLHPGAERFYREMGVLR